MAAAAESAEGFFTSKAGRGLAFGCSFLACLLAAGVLTITLLGRPGGPSAVRLELPDFSPAKPKTVAVLRSSADEAPLMGPVTKPLYAGNTLLADPALVENTIHGPLPRIADDGRKPMAVYAAPAAANAKFKIAVVVNGLGQSAAATKTALASLPAAVTLGFAPYASDVGQWVAQARGQGHEVLLQIPMEPLDFPDSDPGPHTLRSGQEEEANIQRLSWAMSRFTGYAGVSNLLGQRFLTDSEALTPVLTYLNRRGLYFFDNGAASQSVAPMVAGQVGIAAAQSGPPLDVVQSPQEIDRRLSELETQARANGSAVGSAFLYPATVARISAWAKGLQSRGFVLVPVSAIISPSPKQ
ncbi:MAG TPA: divergent polysaccharide deacetylase family protein [Rhizomicrobium sp.]|nr:divergent polysaccharide deacetylase family protein [Rhizomicrobium sp.]